MDVINNAIINTETLTRNFNPESYLENGYQEPILLEMPSSTFTLYTTKYFISEVAKTDIAFFNNMVLDTSAISFIDLGHSFENYDVEKWKSTEYPSVS